MPIRTYSFLQGNIPAEKGNGGVIIAFLHTAVTDLIGKYRSAALKDLTTILKCNKHRLIHTSFILPFSEQEYSSLQERFGKYCVIISGKELESKILSYCKTNEYDYIFDKVEYCNQNRINRIEAFRTGSKERFLYKNSDLEYQREYRLVITIEIPDDHFIRIGKLTSAACIESEKLKDLIFTVNYKSVLNSNE